jgi:hypothetical protein
MIAKVFDAPLCLTERRLHTPPSALIARRILDARILTVPRRSTLSVTAAPFAARFGKRHAVASGDEGDAAAAELRSLMDETEGAIADAQEWARTAKDSKATSTNGGSFAKSPPFEMRADA